MKIDPRRKTAAEPKPPYQGRRDCRVDLLGFIGELQKQFGDDVKTEIKSRMMERGDELVTGDSFQGLLVQSTTATVDPEMFLAMYEAKHITRAQLIAAIKVNRDAALNGLSREQLAAISTEQPASPQLRVTRLKGVDVALVDAVRAVAAAVTQSQAA